MLIAIARHFRRLDRCSSIRSATARSPIRDLRAYRSATARSNVDCR